MRKHSFIPMVAALFLIGGCPLDPKNIGTPDSAGEATEGTDTSTGTGTSVSPAETSPSTDTSTGPTETSPGPDSSESGATDTSTTDTSTTDTSTTSEPGDTDAEDTDSTGEDPFCSAQGPAASAGYKVILDGWPGQSDKAHDVERGCTIDAVNTEAMTVTTMLTCDVDGVPLGAQFVVSAAPEGEVDWSVGQAVTLRAFRFNDDFGQEIDLRVTLQDDPEALLVDGQDWWGEAWDSSIGPIVRKQTSTCELSDRDGQRYGLTYSLMMGANVSIMSGQRGTLPIDATHAYAIDLAHSGHDYTHTSEHSLIRRVKSGG